MPATRWCPLIPSRRVDGLRSAESLNYNGVDALEVQGSPRRGVSSGAAMNEIARIAKNLPQVLGMSGQTFLMKRRSPADPPALLRAGRDCHPALPGGPL